MLDRQIMVPSAPLLVCLSGQVAAPEEIDGTSRAVTADAENRTTETSPEVTFRGRTLTNPRNCRWCRSEITPTRSQLVRESGEGRRSPKRASLIHPLYVKREAWTS